MDPKTYYTLIRIINAFWADNKEIDTNDIMIVELWTRKCAEANKYKQREEMVIEENTINLDSITPDKDFQITTVCRDDITFLTTERKNSITDAEMERIAEGMACNYTSSNFFDDLEEWTQRVAEIEANDKR